MRLALDSHYSADATTDIRLAIDTRTACCWNFSGNGGGYRCQKNSRFGVRESRRWEPEVHSNLINVTLDTQCSTSLQAVAIDAWCATSSLLIPFSVVSIMLESSTPTTRT